MAGAVELGAMKDALVVLGAASIIVPLGRRLHINPVLAFLGAGIILGPHGLAVELRNRNWVEGEQREATLDWYADRGATFVGVDAPPADNFQIMPSIDAVTNPRISYLRAHGRNTKGYLTGRSVAERFASKVRGKDNADVKLPPAPLNAALERIFAAERHFVGRLPLPPGLSLFAVASAR